MCVHVIKKHSFNYSNDLRFKRLHSTDTVSIIREKWIFKYLEFIRVFKVPAWSLNILDISIGRLCSAPPFTLSPKPPISSLFTVTWKDSSKLHEI